MVMQFNLGLPEIVSILVIVLIIFGVASRFRKYLPVLVLFSVSLVLAAVFWLLWVNRAFERLSDGVQAWAVTELVWVTTFYAWQAQDQAKASRQIAEEMKAQRRASARPILSINPELLASTDEPPVWQLKAVLRNVGVGPAMNVMFTCELQNGSGAVRNNASDYAETHFGALGVRDTERVDFSVNVQNLTPGGRGNLAKSPQAEFLTRLVCNYKDVYGSPFSSWLEIGRDVGLIPGPLILEECETGLLARRRTGSGTGL